MPKNLFFAYRFVLSSLRSIFNLLPYFLISKLFAYFSLSIPIHLFKTRHALPKAVHAWFLEIALVHASVCVYVSVLEGINNQWHDMV